MAGSGSRSPLCSAGDERICLRKRMRLQCDLHYLQLDHFARRVPSRQKEANCSYQGTSRLSSSAKPACRLPPESLWSMALLDVNLPNAPGLVSRRSPAHHSWLAGWGDKKEACMQRPESRPRSQQLPSTQAHGRHTSAANRNQA